jgi:hypothetical protein
MLQYVLGGRVHNVGVLLYDASTRHMNVRFREDYGFAPQDEQDVLSLLGDDIAQKLGALHDAITLIEQFEDTLSNTIQISERTPIVVDRDPAEIVDRLYAEYVPEGDSHVLDSDPKDTSAASI